MTLMDYAIGMVLLSFITPCLIIVLVHIIRLKTAGKPRVKWKIALLGTLILSMTSMSLIVVNAKPVYEEYKFTHERVAYYEENYESLLEEVTPEDLEIEYGSEFEFDYNESFKLVDNTEIDTMELGEQEFTMDLLDELGYPVSFAYSITVVDTENPVIEGLCDLNLDYGAKFDVDSLDITATDPVDGDLEVLFSNADKVDPNTPGNYVVGVSTTDLNGNITEEEFGVKIGPKPIPKPEPKPEPQPIERLNSSGSGGAQSAPAGQSTQSIRFANGKVVPYYNGGSSGGQAIIDSNHSVATTWDMYQYVKTHANNDGSPTYFAGHDDGSFAHLKYVGMGETISVKDHSGNVTNYRVTNIYNTNNINIDGGWYPSDSAMNALDSFGGEGIMFQTCVGGNPASNLIIQARP